MVRLTEAMPRVLAETILVREQYALALNRLGRDRDAEDVLRKLLESRGPSSETCGLLGRVYKDRWQRAVATGDGSPRALLKQAIDMYVQGFEADWTDAYPGVNAVTLMELREPPDPRQRDLLPVVRYGVERRIAKGVPDYWDYATRLELAVLARDADAALAALDDAVVRVREPWEAESTAGNLRLVRETRLRRGEDVGWLDEVLAELDRKARPRPAPTSSNAPTAEA
jgi:hypothetical protein